MANTRAQKTAQNLSTLTTAGDIAYASAAGTPARLGIGSSAQVLTVSGGVPSWATPAGGGKVLQVVTATASTSYTNATTTLTDVTGLTATITPTSATSRILVVISATVAASASASVAYVGARLLRGATSIVSYQEYGFIFQQAPGGLQQATIQYMDSPATTSATTYKLQARIDTATNSMTATFQYINNPSVITLFEIGA